jgi:hypothetical protein
VLTNADDNVDPTEDEYFELTGLEDASILKYAMFAGDPDVDEGYRYTVQEITAFAQELANLVGMTDASYFGDAGSHVTLDGEGDITGGGVKQTYTNPDDGYTVIDGSPQLDGEDSGEGDNTLFGSDPGVYDDDGLLTTWLNGETPTDTDVEGEQDRYIVDGENDLTTIIDVDDTVSVGSDPSMEGLGEGALDNDRAGFAGFDWEDGAVTVLTRGNDGPDVIHNFQVGEGADLIALESDLEGSTVVGTVEGRLGEIILVQQQQTPTYISTAPVLNSIPNLTNVGYMFGDVDFSQPFEFNLGFEIDVFSDEILTSQPTTYRVLFPSASNQSFASIQELEDYLHQNIVSITSDNNEGNTASAPAGSLLQLSLVDEVPIDFQTAVMGDEFGGFVGNGIKFEVAEGFVIRSFGPPTQVVGSEAFGSEFNLSVNEFGLVVSEESSLASDDLNDSDLVADLLNSVFDFSLTTANGDLNTTIFAITATDDDSVTAIWAHTQSSADDNTVEALELYQLATVNTIDGEFSVHNFAGVQDILHSEIR